LLARLTHNAGKYTGYQPTRLAQLDDGNDRAILVQGDEGPAQVIQLGHNGTPSVICQRRWCHLLAACPIPSIGTPCDARAIQDDGTSGDRGFRGGRHGGSVAAASRWLARTVIPNSEMRHTMASYLGCGRLECLSGKSVNRRSDG